MRSVRSEILSTLTVLAVPVLVFSVFPYGSFGFSANRRSSERVTSVSFVTLSDDASRAAMRMAKSPLQNTLGATRRKLRVDLRLGELPETGPEPVLTVSARGKRAALAAEEYGFAAFVPSLAAPEPIAIPKVKDESRPLPFPREELLNLE